MKKEIIGYVLKKREYTKAVNEIIDNDDWFPQISFVNGSDSYNKLLDAGVLDIWFEPVYKDSEFKFGRWYKLKEDDSYIAFINEDESGYGIYINEWFNHEPNSGEWALDDFSPASDTEVEERLLAYAKKHYPVGTEFKSASNDVSMFTVGGNCFYKYKEWDAYNFAIAERHTEGLIYVDGKWAEIIKEPSIKINGYEAKFEEKHVSFGCQKVSVKFIKKAHALMTEHNVDFNANKEQIKKIVEHYK